MLKNNLKIKVDYQDVIIRMGANIHKTKIDTKTENTILESIDFVEKIIDPKYAISITDKLIKDNKILLNDFVIESKDIHKLLENSNKVCGLVATIGKSLDEKINSLFEENKIYLAYIYDSIGSVAIETLVDAICKEINLQYGSTTMRFSPGYGDWPITNQPNFLKWLGADKIGIYLLPSCQMVPRKSVSAIMGIL